MTIEAMELLRHGIIARACMDYDAAIRYLARAPEKQTEGRTIQQEAVKAECERFFYSNWFRVLCELDGETVMRGVARNGYCGNNFTANSHIGRKIQGNSAGSGAERKWRSMRNERDIREFKAFLRALIPMMVMGCGMYAWALILWMVAG